MRRQGALRESEEKYRQVFAAESSAILLVDAASRRIVDVNPAAVTLYGYTDEEFLAMKYEDLTAERKASLEALKRIAAGELTWIPLRYHRKRNGAVFPVEISASTFVLGGRRTVCGVMRDITERVEAQREIVDYQERLRSMASELVLGEQRERRRIAGGLHDQIGQTLTLVCMRMEVLAEAAGTEELRGQCRELLTATRGALDATRSLTFELSPPLLYESGLAEAVRALGRELEQGHGITFTVESTGQSAPLGEDVTALLFRTVRELMMNVVKHSMARTCQTTFCWETGRLLVTVQDDGIGFGAGLTQMRRAGQGGFGLFSVHERLKGLGGGLEIESKPNQGCLIRLWVPRPSATADRKEEVS